MNKLCSIILIDDDEDDQMIFTSAIGEISKEIICTCYDNALHGLKVLRNNYEQKPDCIFLDLNLPLMSGFDFLQEIKSSNELTEIHVIIYSTSSREADKAKAMQLGAFNFLSKPSTYLELKEKVTGLLNSAALFQ